MVVNPSLKLDWIDQHWTPAQSKMAEAAVKAEMLRVQAAIDSDLRAARATAAAARANWAQNHGYMRLLTLGANLCRASSMHTGEKATFSSRQQSLVGSSSRSCSSCGTPGPSFYQPVDPQARNQAIVEDEFTRYIDAETIPVDQMGSVDLTEYWKVHQYTYLLLFRIAMDVLPAQASSASSERVFSSSKLTCTSARNRITPENMEFLQVLKHALARHRREVPEGADSQDLDFISHLYENLALEDD
ncbi:hypothetical protein FRC08_000793 [Ceratobasidium sp. 394]|nr:hypothetical protein FRC08_000793 [Ceratobasidium sp. 394]